MALKILTVGGGSGGHIIPVVAVIEALKRQDKTAQFWFWCDKKSLSMTKTIFDKNDDVTIDTVRAGRFRRYNHLKWWQHLAPSILVPNIIDVFNFGFGFVQSYFKLLKLKPDVVFAKGGFVSLPVGLAAKTLKIKLIIHDSDTVAGLTNRILSRYAVKITTGMPVEYYSYSPEKTIFVGSPVKKRLKTTNNIDELKARLGLPVDKKILLIVGGGLGSMLFNKVTLANLDYFSDDIRVVLITGNHNFEETKLNMPAGSSKLEIFNFINNLDEYVAVADLIVSRGGATAIAEIAAASKPLILIPNPKLVGGHQIKNTKMLVAKQAAVCIEEAKLEESQLYFSSYINKLIHDEKELDRLAQAIKEFSKPDAASDLATIIIKIAAGRDA